MQTRVTFLFPGRLAVLTIAVTIAVTDALLCRPALACGFDNPAAMAKGMLNWIYPKSLYVDTAVWQAQRDGLLAREEALPASKSLLFNPGYRRAVRTVQEFAAATGKRVTGVSPQPFTLLLMEAALYSRVSYGESGVLVQPHVNGSAPGEPVLITHRVVLEALNSGSLSPTSAFARGLMKIYGTQAKADDVVALVGQAYSAAGETSFSDATRR